MEELQLDYATLVSVYQTKVTELLQQNIILEAKNLILSKKLQELLNNSSAEVKSTPTRKKGLDKPVEENTY
jgi:hypothetical protein